MDSFLGGGLNFGSDIPSYGDVGPGYTGDFFDTGSSGGGGIGSAILGGLGRGILGSLTGGGSSSRSRSSDRVSYTDQTKGNIRDLLALAMRSFAPPQSLV